MKIWGLWVMVEICGLWFVDYRMFSRCEMNISFLFPSLMYAVKVSHPKPSSPLPPSIHPNPPYTVKNPAVSHNGWR